MMAVEAFFCYRKIRENVYAMVRDASWGVRLVGVYDDFLCHGEREKEAK